MPVLVDDDTRILVQGLSGSEGTFHTAKMLQYGTNIVGGVTPGFGGQWIHGKPIFDTMRVAIAATEANTSVVFVPSEFATDAIYEAVDAGIRLIICITEGIPALDMMRAIAYVRNNGASLIGPNSPGILIPNLMSIGIFPTEIASVGNIGIVSRSGALTYEVMYALTQAGLGQSACIGIGGDTVHGTGFVEVLEMFENDPQTTRVILLGEIGGNTEIDAAEYIMKQMSKPVGAFIAGKTAPEGKRMGHAGAIIEGGRGSAQEKIQVLQNAGVQVANHPEELIEIMKMSLE